MYNECRHIKTNGSKCQAPALHGAAYCYFHMRLHRMMHRRKTESANPASDVPLDLPVIEDRSAIQLALTQVLQDLAAKRLDPRRASQLLYGLQIASQVVGRPAFTLADRAVQNLSTGSDGEELGPAVTACDQDDDCDVCPQNQTCPRCVLSDEIEDEE